MSNERQPNPVVTRDGRVLEGNYDYAELLQLREYEYTDSQRLDEMLTAEDYNRFEEEQVAQDREGELESSNWEEDPEGWVDET
jgi:hypothetical protein